MPGLTRRALLGASIAAVAAALAACGRPGLPLAAPPDPVLRVASDSDWVRAARVLAGLYRHEGRQAEVTTVAAGIGALVRNLLAGTAATPADVLLVTPVIRRIWQATSLMLDLGPALADTDLDATIYPSLLADGSFQGRQLVMPIFRDPLVIFYNADALARAGNNAPAPTWGYPDLMELCGRLAAEGTHPILQSESVSTSELLAAFVIGFGGQVLAAGPSGGTGYVPMFTQPAALAGISALVTLLGFVPPPTNNSALETFAQGGAAMLFGHHQDVANLSAAIGSLFAWNVAPLPTFPRRAAQPVQAQGLAAVTTSPERRPDAIAFTLFGATAQGQDALARAGLGVPASSNLAASPLWRASAPLLDNDVFVSNTAADIVVPEPLYFLPQLDLAIRASLRGVPVDEAFGAAATASEFTLANWPNQ